MKNATESRQNNINNGGLAVHEPNEAITTEEINFKEYMILYRNAITLLR